MAAATIAEGPHNNVIGRKRQVQAKLTAPADGSTFDSGLYRVDHVGVTFSGASAAADSTSVSVSGGTVTFNVIGTARDLYLTVTGI